MSGDGLQGLENILAGFSDAATGNFTAAGDRFAAAGDPAGGPEPVPQVTGKTGRRDRGPAVDGAAAGRRRAGHGQP